MKEAIQKAIEGGYRYKRWGEDLTNSIATDPHQTEEADILLDPLFWQALGKAMGRGRENEDMAVRLDIDVKFYYKEPRPSTASELIEQGNEEERIKYHLSKYATHLKGRDWLHEMHRFIDHLTEGKDAESFFKELLK